MTTRLLFFAVVLSLSLTGCVTDVVVTTPDSQEEIFGLWVKDNGGGNFQGYSFNRDTSLDLVNVPAQKGLSWKLTHSTLVLTIEEKGKTSEKEFVIKKLNPNQLYLAFGDLEYRFYRPVSQKTITGTMWSLLSIGEMNIEAGEKKVHLMFMDEGQLNGFSGCNRYFSGYSIKNQQINIGPIAGTMAMCPDMEIESKFLDGLTKTATYLQVENKLYFYGDKGETVTFTASKE